MYPTLPKQEGDLPHMISELQNQEGDKKMINQEGDKTMITQDNASAPYADNAVPLKGRKTRSAQTKERVVKTRKAAQNQEDTKVQYLVLDGGNGNTKAILTTVAGDKHYVIMPSLLTQRTYSEGIMGGFKLQKQDWVLGGDNIGRVGTISINAVSDGKIKYFAHILSGVLSALEEHLDFTVPIELTVLSLNPHLLKVYTDKLKLTKTLEINGQKTQPIIVIDKVLPEGNLVKETIDNTNFLLLDCGNGSLNLSVYNLGRRELFQFQPVGFSKLVSIVCEILQEQTTNGSTDPELVRFALESNTSLYMDSYEGLDISDEIRRGVQIWTELPETKKFLLTAMRYQMKGLNVSLIGGGFVCTALSEAVIKILGSTSTSVHPNPLFAGLGG